MTLSNALNCYKLMSIAPQEHKEAPPSTIKLLLLGESSVGKSSLVNRYTDHTFQSNGILTIGIEVKKIMKQIGSKKIRLELWDTAGQQKYRTLPSQYYRGIQGILLVYDITNLDSFMRVEEWFNKIEQNCQVEQLDITLVGNKVDLQPNRQVHSTQAESFAKNHKMKFKETSAKTSANVEQTVQQMMQSIIRKGRTEAKKDKLVLADQDRCRKPDNDSCC